MSWTPVISYLVAVRNKAMTIERCLDSLIGNDADQVIVVDGRSTDGTTKIIDEFSVQHLYDDGKGLSIARNIGLSKCVGDYVVVIDGDEWIPGKFQSNLKQMLVKEKCDAVTCSREWIGSTCWAKAHQAAWWEVSFMRPSWINVPRIFKRSILLKLEGWDDYFSSYEDRDLWKRMELLKPKIHMSQLVIYQDASDLSILTEYQRGKWYGSSLLKYVRRHHEWLKLINVLPANWGVDLAIALRVLGRTRKISLALRVFVLRLTRSVGWLTGFFLSKREQAIDPLKNI